MWLPIGRSGASPLQVSPKRMLCFVHWERTLPCAKMPTEVGAPSMCWRKSALPTGHTLQRVWEHTLIGMPGSVPFRVRF